MHEVLTVTELTSAIKKHLESRFVAVTVRGEISNFKEQASGHLYFTLKDAEAQISAVLFRGNAKLLSRLPKGGDQVIVKGELSVYAPRGNYQIIVRELQYAGVGELLLKLHELKAKLEQKGWFAAERKKALPKFPKTIGVVTSPTGSVIQDILNILTRRFAGFHLILNPVKVQGEGAAQEIALAIEEFNKHQLADVLIVGRGGGSLEDLWAFNEEIVAQAIYNSKIPVVSAVGHETDFCIADYVADRRAPTPSAAAEIVSAEKSHYINFLKQASAQMKKELSGRIKQQRHRLQAVSLHPMIQSPYSVLGKYHQLIDDAGAALDRAFQVKLSGQRLLLQAKAKELHALKPTTQIAHARKRLAEWEKMVVYKSRVAIQQNRERLRRLTSHLKGIDPRNLLTKGYCILFSENKSSAILTAQSLHTDQNVQILLHDGTARATINEIL